MKRFVVCFSIFFSILIFNGCLEFHTLVKVNPDGSGTIEEKFLMSKAVAKMIASLSESFSSDSIQKREPLTLFDEDEIKADTAKLGKNVKYVSGRKLSENGQEGFRAVYNFKDLNDLHINQNPNSQIPLDESGKVDSVDKEYVNFQFIPGEPAKIIIHLAQNKNDTSSFNFRNQFSDSTTFSDSTMYNEVVKMMTDLKISLDLKLNGKIVNTNASYVQDSTITLFNIDFNEMLKDPQKAERIQEKETAKSSRTEKDC